MAVLLLLPLLLVVVFTLPVFMVLPSHGSPWIFFWRSLFSAYRLLGEASPTPSSRNSQLEYPSPPCFCSSHTPDQRQPNRALLRISESTLKQELTFCPKGCVHGIDGTPRDGRGYPEDTVVAPGSSQN